jgi:hypothetical protein
MRSVVNASGASRAKARYFKIFISSATRAFLSANRDPSPKRRTARRPKGSNLFWRPKLAMLPAPGRFHRVINHRFDDTFALRTFKGPQIRTGRAMLNPGQHHAALTLRAAWSLNRKQGGLGMIMIMRVRHVMHPCWIRREHNTLSVTDECRGRCGDFESLVHLMSESRHKSCPLVDINSGSLAERK